MLDHILLLISPFNSILIFNTPCAADVEDQNLNNIIY